jgi:hypothetical protein
MTDYHEPYELLTPSVRDEHRALTSFKEEIEAVDWYNQRVAVCENQELRAVLAHNRDEEIEHACMTLEWLRRNMPKWDEHLRTYLFKSEPITEIEEEEPGKGQPGAPDAPRPGRSSLGIGSLKAK